MLENKSLVGISLYVPLFLIVPVSYYGSSTFRKSKLLEDWRKYYKEVKVLIPYLQPRDKAEMNSMLRFLTAIFLCVVVGRGINIASPLLLRSALDHLSTPAGREGSFPWKQIAGYILLRYSIRDTMSYIQWAVTRRLENQVEDRITIAVYNRMMSLSADYHDNKNSGTVWHTVHSSGENVSGFVSKVCFGIIPDFLDLIFAAIAFGSVCGAHLVWVVLLVLAAYVLVLIKTADKDSTERDEWIKAWEKKTNMSSDAIPNWWTVSLFGRLDYEKDRHAEAVNHFRALDTRWCEDIWLVHNLKHLILSSGLLALCLLVGHDIWHTAGRSGGDLVMFTQLWSAVTSPAEHILSWNKRIESFSMNVKKLLNILREDLTVTDREGAENFQLNNGSIEIKNVAFSYKEKRQVVIKDVSFNVEGGKITAIVGESGGGKSTLLKLLMRSYDPTSGTITIDKQDIKAVRKASLIQQMSIVPQTIGVFNNTILENLRYAKPDATLAECEEACKAVGLHEKITNHFDKRYDEIVGEKGVKLSGGELQRLAIARVLLRDSKIVLFDEATSSLDSATESRIREYLRKWCVGRTVVIVAHRLASIVNADVILAFKDGGIVERGTHEELLAKKGYFWELWDRQRLG